VRFTRSVDPRILGQFLASRLTAPLSYPEVGASLGELPPGYRHDTRVVWLGVGDAAFARAGRGLEEWEAHHRAGVVVHPSDVPIVAGTTVALAVPLFGVHALAACRIVAVVREANRFGFSYGTITGHPERGEEAFIIERDGDTVRFRITAFSKPADPLARIGAPVARLVQQRVTRAYFDGLRRYMAAGN
jgi:uncharacterized protein (UPF0548 family)